MRDAIDAHCRQTIRDGSQSFAGAARIFDPRTRAAAHQLYAWCRYCDDQVDGEPAPRTPRQRLERLVERTAASLASPPPGDPVFAALHRVVAEHAIPHHLPYELLEGFAMDVERRRYAEPEDVFLYSYHVAGTVGLMMAHVMGVRDKPTLCRAADLGIALQMTNIARDVLDDARVGRVYLPQRWLAEAAIPADEVAAPYHRERLADVTARLLVAADLYYASGTQGIAQLPWRSAWATVVARGVYSEIGRLVRSRRALAWERRAVVTRPRKLGWVARGLMETLFLKAVTSRRAVRPRTGLWTQERWLD